MLCGQASPKQKAAWIKEHGTRILDFGAGHLTEPMDAYFAEISARPPQIKEHLLTTYIFPKYGEPQKTGYFGLESNPLTRSMYAKYAISAIRVSDQEMMLLPPG